VEFVIIVEDRARRRARKLFCKPTPIDTQLNQREWRKEEEAKQPGMRKNRKRADFGCRKKPDWESRARSCEVGNELRNGWIGVTNKQR